MAKDLFDDALDEFERELDPVDSIFDEVLEEFDDELEVGGEYYDEENDGYFQESEKLLNKGGVENENQIIKENSLLEEKYLSMSRKDDHVDIGSVRLEKSNKDPIHPDIDKEESDRNVINKWNQKDRILKRHERRYKRHNSCRERKHRIFEMSREQAIEMKLKLVEKTGADDEASLLELNMLSAEVSSALSTVQEIEKRRQDLKQRLSEVHRASRLRRPRSADVRPSALMAAVGTPRESDKDSYALELSKQLDASLPLLLEARQVLEALQKERSKKLSTQSLNTPPLPLNLDVSDPLLESKIISETTKPVMNTPLVQEREQRKPSRSKTSEVILLSMLGIKQRNPDQSISNIPPSPPPKRYEKKEAEGNMKPIKSSKIKSINLFNWRQLAEDRCLMPAHELAKLKAMETVSPDKRVGKNREKKVKFAESSIKAGNLRRELGSDFQILWRQIPTLNLPFQETVSELSSAELAHESHVYDVFASESAVESVRLLMLSLKDCSCLKDFATAAHAFERYWGQSRRQDVPKQRPFVEAHELMCHLCTAVRFAHVAYLPAVLATLDTFCTIKCHRFAVLKDGCVNAVLSRLNSAEKNTSNRHFKALDHYGQRLISSLLWQSEGLRAANIYDENKEVHSFAKIYEHATDNAVIKEIDRHGASGDVLSTIRGEEIMDYDNKNLDGDKVGDKIYERDKQCVISNSIVIDPVVTSESGQMERPELSEAKNLDDTVIVKKEGGVIGNLTNLSLTSPSITLKNKRSEGKRIQKIKDKEASVNIPPESIPVPAENVYTKSELRILRKKERRNKQRSSLKASLPRT